jgi:hypothetical protein
MECRCKKMKTIQQFVPERRPLGLEEITSEEHSYPLAFFDERTLLFFQQLSNELIRHSQFQRNPEIVSLSFWLRKASLELIRKQNAHLVSTPSVFASPMGMVFHVCPANVDTMFVYSICISVLAGNKNVIRISSDINPETDHLLESLNRVLLRDEHQLMRSYIRIINYPHDDEISNALSLLADARVIWGGDKTVETFKKFSTKPRCKDIVFPNRISYSLLDMKAFVSMAEKQQSEWIRAFYNDTYVFNQKGCSSPQLLFLMNSDERKEAAFYQALLSHVKQKYETDIASLASLKYNSLIGDIVTGKTRSAIASDNFVYLVQLGEKNELPENCGGGYFYFTRIQQPADILPFIHSSSQTLTYLGLSSSQLDELNLLLRGKGIDRIVEPGNALKFNNYWDGYNLLDELTRKRYIEMP